MKKRHLHFFTLILGVFLFFSTGKAQTTLTTGDIAFTAINTDGSIGAPMFDSFSIVALVPIDAGTQIRFSDVQYLDASGFAAPNGSTELEFVWTAPAGGIAYMEQVSFWSTGSSNPANPNTDKGSVSGNGLLLGTVGDQIFAVQGASMNSGTILAGIHTNYESGETTAANWDEGAASNSSESELPDVLTNGSTAIWVYASGPSQVDNASFTNCAAVSPGNSAAVNRAAINNISNWSSSNSTIYSLPPCGDVLPVELTTFTGLQVNGTVELTWETATEINNYGFEVEREYRDVSSEYGDWEKIGFVQGHGTTNSSKQYNFVDNELPNDATEVTYRLKQVDNDGTYKYSKEVTVDISTITNVKDEAKRYEFALEQNYPNPFNPVTKIKYTISNVEIQHAVSLRIYNVLGKEVATLVNESKPAGAYELEFNAIDLPSGMYFYKLEAGSFVQTKKMVLIK